MPDPISVPQVAWVREYLKNYYPDQPLTERTDEPNTIIIDVNDAEGRLKQLRISLDFLLELSKAEMQDYLHAAKIAEQIEARPSSVDIRKPNRVCL